MDPKLDLFVIFLSNRLHPDGQGNVNPLAGRIGAIAAAAIVDRQGRDSVATGGLTLSADSPVAKASRPLSSTAQNPPPLKAGAREGTATRHASPGKKRHRQHVDSQTHADRPSPKLSPNGRGTAAGRGSGSVLTGIDVLVRDDFKPLQGRRVGLITNHTGLSRDGQRTVDLLHQADGLELFALFSPEHGIAGKLDREGIGDEVDAATGLKVFSLYDGPNRRPKPEQLEGLDTLVFDIQDVGARFYTYASTMGWAMETAALNNLRFVVLDRPNPIGGLAAEGPLADEGRESFVGFHTIPVRHGMTVGELAEMYRAERDLKVDLEVVKCDAWRRRDYWDATGLAWVNPSPNMRSLAEAVLYPGMGLWETTNLSVGRGTDTPFEVLGAPWIDARQFAAELNAAGLPGVRFVPIQFTPEASKYSGEKCGGVNVIVVNRAKFEPIALGLELACTLRRLYKDQWQTDAADRLLINQQAYDAILSGKSRQEIQKLYKSDLEEFRKRRQKFLLYHE
ncbi:MAG: DUF1343 domain-containing protein [Pirellulales bacterium]|nr:DUF1343 domain-containing protein [Pirellulales bacterium]